MRFIFSTGEFREPVKAKDGNNILCVVYRGTKFDQYEPSTEREAFMSFLPSGKMIENKAIQVVSTFPIRFCDMTTLMEEMSRVYYRDLPTFSDIIADINAVNGGVFSPLEIVTIVYFKLS